MQWLFFVSVVLLYSSSLDHVKNLNLKRMSSISFVPKKRNISEKHKAIFLQQNNSTNGVEMQNVDTIARRPKKRTIKKSPLGMALNLDDQSTTHSIYSVSQHLARPKVLKNRSNQITFKPPLNRETVVSTSITSQYPSHNPAFNHTSMSFDLNSMQFGSGPPVMNLNDPFNVGSLNTMPSITSQPSLPTGMSVSVANEKFINSAQNDDEVIGDDDGENNKNVMTPRGDDRFDVQTPFDDDIIIEEDENNGDNKSPFAAAIDTGKNGEYHINMNELEEDEDVDNVDTGESEDAEEDDDDVVIGNGDLTIGWE